MNRLLQLLKDHTAIAEWITAVAVLIGGVVWLINAYRKRSDRDYKLYSSIRALIHLTLETRKNLDKLQKGIAKLKGLHPIHEDTLEGMERMLREGAFTVPGSSSETRTVQNGVEKVEKNDPAYHYRSARGSEVMCGSEEFTWRGIGEEMRDELLTFLDENSLREDLK